MVSSMVDDIRLVAKAGGSTIASEAFTVVAIQRVEWVNDGQLSDNAHPDPMARIGQRIFPDAAASGGDPQNKVKVRAMITPAIAGVTVFFRSIDVDDPSAEGPPVDDEMKTQDNRACATTANCQTPNAINDGAFINVNGNPVGNGTSATTSNGGSAQVQFQVTMQPGDNFRVVATCLSQESITGDKVQAQQKDGMMARVKDAMGNFILSDSTTAAAVKASAVLTVWRKLHMEVDSMAAIPAGVNKVTGQVNSIFPFGSPGSGVKRIYVDQNLDDGSALIPDADTSPTARGGRYENGTMRIGNLNQPNAMVRLAPIQGNGITDGDHFVQFLDTNEFRVPFTIRRSTLTVAQGMVRDMTGEIFTLTGDLTKVRTGDTLVVGGAGMTISDVSPPLNQVTVQQVSIGFELVDDDEAVMPHPTKDEFLPLFNQKYGVAYIEAVVDGGGDINHNSSAVPFMLNVEINITPAGLTSLDGLIGTLPNALQSDGKRSKNYWVAHVLYAYQSSKVPSQVNAFRADGDPDSEDNPTEGFTAEVSGMARGSFIFREETREQEAIHGVPIEHRTVIHEVGHQFGLPERGPSQGIMGDTRGPDSAFVFTGTDIVRLRSRVESPGSKEAP
jgi:hypothetical protein